MEKEEKKMCVVSQQQLKEAVEKKLNFVRVSFQDESDPIYLVYKKRPNADDISEFLRDKLHLFSDNYVLMFSENDE